MKETKFEFVSNKSLSLVKNEIIDIVDKLFIDNMSTKPRKYQETLKCICYNLLKMVQYNYDMCYVAVGKNVKIRKPYSQAAICNFMNVMEDAGYVSVFRGYCTETTKELSYFILNDKFSSILGKVSNEKVPPVEDVIVIRDSSGNHVSVTLTEQEVRSEMILREYNKSIQNHLVYASGEYHTMSLRRIFKNNTSSGGRLYADMGCIQGLSRDSRKTLTIDGEKTIELDYKSMHLAMLYEIEGKDCCFEYDPYTTGCYDREFNKQILMVMINSKTSEQATKAIRMKLFGGKRFESMTTGDITNGMNAILSKHPFVAKYFNTGYGLTLQKLDSEIMLGILSRCLECGVVCLPIHDSVVIKESDFGKMLKFMHDSYCDVMGSARNCRIEVK